MRTHSAKILRAGFGDSSKAEETAKFLGGLSARELHFLHYDWELWARDDQLPPGAASDGTPWTTPWTTWLMLGGRGAGKTRAGAEWVRSFACAPRPRWQAPPRIALVGETFSDARAVMVEGVSGLLSVHPPSERPVFEASKRLLTWPNGAKAQLFSAEDPEALRGPQFDAAWADELAKWRNPEATWDMLQFGLRLGERPRQIVTTTPRPVPLIKALLADPKCAVSRVATAANAANLAPRFLDAIVGKYRGTRLGRQELEAEILEDRADALWPRAMLEGLRVAEAPDLRRVVVAVDPPVTSGERADACGIVAAGTSASGEGYVLADRSAQGLSPAGWARAAIAAYHAFEADCIVAEVNQGGELVASVLRQVDADVPVRPVRASRGKWLRAEPVAALYEQGRIFHVGSLPALEDEMSDFGPEGLSGGRSPDRVDALVWALTALMLTGRPEPRVRGL
ncbi:terminase family protein [Methyloligella sp. 2.7D]|uniref:DNA-packaging protein n=1 Tax=unclassified Methyloligella TaxID=2625955 RepID=UPI00157C211F|nr:terminase family protein [Methyloligella sp. GL2]QKP77109.1 DNA-packaging protein [Methyloligella sp. GL2]